MNSNNIGFKLHNLAQRLWPINRSITGEGVRKTLSIIKELNSKLSIKEVKSGTKVFDWIVPLEWHVSKAYIITPNGKKICDFSINNLHLISYSIPFHGKMQLKELQKYLYSLPNNPMQFLMLQVIMSEDGVFALAKNKEIL